MLITLVVEFAGATYTLMRYKMNNVGRTIVLILCCLGLFQLAEYMVCEKIGGVEWSRVGFFATTLLPPLGITLGLSVAKAKSKAINIFKIILWSICALVLSYVLFFKDVFKSEVCLGNYVIFYTTEMMWIYSAYYFSTLTTGLIGGLFFARRTKDKNTKQSLYAIIFGALSFLVPTFTITLINHDTIEAIPSIMCGFAVIFALVLLLIVLPTSGLKRTSQNISD
jgi:hypothetical protein